MAPRMILGKMKPRTNKWIELWIMDIRNKDDHLYIESEVKLSCCEIEKAPDMGPEAFRAEIFFRFPSGAGCSKMFFFELDVDKYIDDYIKEEENRDDFTLRFDVNKRFNILTIDCTLWYGTTIQVNDLRLFRGSSSNVPLVV